MVKENKKFVKVVEAEYMPEVVTAWMLVVLSLIIIFGTKYGKPPCDNFIFAIPLFILFVHYVQYFATREVYYVEDKRK
jgi:hypothetical protein